MTSRRLGSAWFGDSKHEHSCPARLRGLLKNHLPAQQPSSPCTAGAARGRRDGFSSAPGGLVRRSQSPLNSSSCRIAIGRQADPGQRLDEALIKDITGGDTISARELYQKLFEFKPKLTLWLAANSKPVIRGQDEGIWRRILTLPFEVTIPVEERDRDLPDRLREELPGILNWAIEGLRFWRENGLQPPDTVIAATKAYRDEMNWFREFIQTECEVGPKFRVSIDQLWQRYRDWCEENGEKHRTKRGLGRMLLDEKFPRKKWYEPGQAHEGVKGPPKRQQVRGHVGLRVRRTEPTSAEPRP